MQISYFFIVFFGCVYFDFNISVKKEIVFFLILVKNIIVYRRLNLMRRKPDLQRQKQDKQKFNLLKAVKTGLN